MELIHSGQIPSQRVGRTYWVQRSDIDTWIAAHALTPGQLGPTCGGRPRRSNLDALDAALDAGWNLDQLSVKLEVTAAKIERWHDIGVPNPYVQRLRDLAAQ